MNSITGVDYAWGRPGGARLHAAGVAFAMRYVSHDNTGKNLTREEAADLAAHGVQIGLVWEGTAKRALDGHNAGASDAAVALAQAHACGMPATKPIYVAVDFDTTPADIGQIAQYLGGWHTVIPPARTGIYGGYLTVSRVMGAGQAAYGWQTTAWSNGKWYPGAHLRQSGGNRMIGGVDCDSDQALGDVGLWVPGQATKPPAPHPPTPLSHPYTVVAGDTMTSIATDHHVTLAALEHANPQIHNFNLIYPGQTVHIPA